MQKLGEVYDVRTTPDKFIYAFVSQGPKGAVTKLVAFTETEQAGLFNLGFGDYDPMTGEVNDLAVTDNGDSQKVLATIVQIVYAFTELIPEAVVVAFGSTPARMRLYQMGISSQLTAAQTDFYIWGLVADNWFPFEKNQPYRALRVKRKIGA